MSLPDAVNKIIVDARCNPTSALDIHGVLYTNSRGEQQQSPDAHGDEDLPIVNTTKCKTVQSITVARLNRYIFYCLQS